MTIVGVISDSVSDLFQPVKDTMSKVSSTNKNKTAKSNKPKGHYFIGPPAPIFHKLIILNILCPIPYCPNPSLTALPNLTKLHSTPFIIMLNDLSIHAPPQLLTK